MKCIVLNINHWLEMNQGPFDYYFLLNISKPEDIAIIKPKKENYPTPSDSQRSIPYPVSYLKTGEILYVRMPWGKKESTLKSKVLLFQFHHCY